MTQPPREATGAEPAAAGGRPAHPQPGPVPVPEPEPPQPVPPSEPIPAPEPPHALGTPQPGTARPEPSSPRTVSIAAAESAADPRPATTEFIDAPPRSPTLDRPPAGAYPDEPGHPPAAAQPAIQPAAQPAAGPGQPAAGAVQLAADTAPDGTDQPTAALPAVQDRTQPVEPVTAPQPGRHQPPPAEPFHARHERPGEWRTEPPEHLAFEHSPPAQLQPGVQGDQGGVGHPPWQVPLLPLEQDESRRRRTRSWVALALVVTLLLCGGGATSAYVLLRNADSGKGAPDPATAVNRFMTAVYTQQDAAAADQLVCREARDKQKLAARVDQIKGYAAEYDGPTFRWNDPAVAGQTGERATVSVQLTMATDDERQAQQNLTFTVVHKSGWLVCDVAG
jgi:hypothetical protein